MISYSNFLKKIKTKKEEGVLYVFCIIRKKWLISTPEEVVRQAALLYLIHLGYVIKHITVERHINVYQLSKRYDIVVSDRNGQIILLVECKAPKVKISQTAMNQAGIYNLALKGRYIWTTNGHSNRIFAIDHLKKECKELDQLPSPLL